MLGDLYLHQKFLVTLNGLSGDPSSVPLLRKQRKKKGSSQVAPVVKSLPANKGDIRDVGSVPGSKRSPGGGHGSPLQYSCLESPHGQRILVGYSP